MYCCIDIEILTFLQDNQIRLSGRVSQYLIDRFEDNRGIDCERLYRFLTDAHMKSGQLLFFFFSPLFMMQTPNRNDIYISMKLFD